MAMALGETVLSSPLVFALIWTSVGAGDKRALRCVSRRVRELADDSVTSVDMQGRRSLSLPAALALWPGVTSLKSCYRPDSVPALLSSAPLAHLSRLELRYKVRSSSSAGWRAMQNARHAHACIRNAWRAAGTA
jgi:hypothetical protein